MKIQKVVVIGACTMGHAIARSFALGGLSAYCVDIEESILRRALKLIKANLATLEDQGAIAKASSEDAMKRISVQWVKRSLTLLTRGLYRPKN